MTANSNYICFLICSLGLIANDEYVCYGLLCLSKLMCAVVSWLKLMWCGLTDYTYEIYLYVFNFLDTFAEEDFQIAFCLLLIFSWSLCPHSWDFQTQLGVYCVARIPYPWDFLISEKLIYVTCFLRGCEMFQLFGSVCCDLYEVFWHLRFYFLLFIVMGVWYRSSSTTL